MTSITWSLYITFGIGWIVKECSRAIGQRVSPQANWGLIGLGLAASACLFATLLR